jgi:4-aminobutyrate aminotransferase / (S)-3-amino-2-methylpropionate transaminase / 5-aminovalerate transaminase
MDQATKPARVTRVTTDIPGPRSKAIIERQQAATPVAMSLHLPIVVDRCEGSLVHDVDGNTYIDWAGGVGCLNVGHVNPRVRDAIVRQVDRFTHTDFTILPYENYVTLAERLNASVPIAGHVKSCFFNSGAEAVENSIKIAKAATGRAGVICFEGAFHGRTLMAMSLTSKTHPYKAGFGPFASEVYRAPYPNPLRDGLEPEDAAEVALAKLRGMFNTHVAAETVAAIIVEPVQGEGGFLVPHRRFLEGLREIADEHGIVLIFDEVQSGFGRTGKLWATEHFGVEPDMILTAKSIAMGIPLSGVIGKASVLDLVPDSGIGGTYVGNPVGIEASLAVLDELEGGVLEQGARLGERLKTAFDEIAASEAGVAESRGLGPMRAIEFVKPGTLVPDGERATAIIEHAARNGLLLLKAGVGGNCIRVLVPLNIPEEQAEESLDILRAAVEASRGDHPHGLVHEEAANAPS